MKKLIFGTISLATILIVAATASASQWIISLVALLVGLGWLVAQYQRWPRLRSPAFFFFVVVAALGMLTRSSSLWLFLAVLVGLTAWDLGQFAHQLAQTSDLRDETGLIRSHLNRLTKVLGGSLVLGTIGLNLQFQFSILPAVLLGLIGILALNWAMRRMRRVEG